MAATTRPLLSAVGDASITTSFISSSHDDDDEDEEPAEDADEMGLEILHEMSSFERLQRNPVARRALGISLLLFVVFLWTASNFLTSSIFADDSYSKPYFVTYLDTSIFAFALIPVLSFRQCQKRSSSKSSSSSSWGKQSSPAYAPVSGDEDSSTPLTAGEGPHESIEIEALHELPLDSSSPSQRLTFRETAKLSFEFAVLWFVANYFTVACLKYTTVASATILTSTSSIWTLIIGAFSRVENFSFKKMFCVLCSLAGVVIIYSVDQRGKTDEERGKFPEKTTHEIAIGDAMALLSAVFYGLYTTNMKKRIGDESRVNMLNFFGMVGIFNILMLWPGLLILNYTGLETFELPPSGKIWLIVLLNGFSSFISDICWAYAMLLTSPLVVTIGLSLNIPLALLGQLVLQDQHSTVSYWIGAIVVVFSFILINYDGGEKEEDKEGKNVDRGGVVVGDAVQKQNSRDPGLGIAMGGRASES